MNYEGEADAPNSGNIETCLPAVANFIGIILRNNIETCQVPNEY